MTDRGRAAGGQPRRDARDPGRDEWCPLRDEWSRGAGPGTGRYHEGVNPRLARAARITGLWLLVAGFVSLQNIAVGRSRGHPIDWQWDVVHELVYWMVWAGVTPLVLWMADRWALGRGAGLRSIWPHLGVMVPLGAFQITATYLVHLAGLEALGLLPAGQAATWLAARGPSIVWGTFTGAAYYWGILGIYHAVIYQRLYRAERLAAAELEARLTQAQLDALRAQLHPHFLFNTLNAISVLTTEDPAKANRMLLRLGDLLRATLDATDRDQVTLDEELALLDQYLEIQQIRFEERLEVEIDVAGDARAALVPTLLLQPLVENAIRHGIERRPDGGRITVVGRRRDDTMELEVRDTGPGLEPGAPGVGIGLANARARLSHLYGAEYRLALEEMPGEGTAVKIAMPFRCASSS